MISPPPLKTSLFESAFQLLSSAWQQWLESLYRQVNGLRGSKTWDPGSIASGASTTTTVTVTGAALGDFASVSASGSLAGLGSSAYVSASDTVTVVLNNNTGSPVDLASMTWKVIVIK